MQINEYNFQAKMSQLFIHITDCTVVIKTMSWQFTIGYNIHVLSPMTATIFWQLRIGYIIHGPSLKLYFGRKWHQFFHSGGLNYATYARCQVMSCVTKVGVCHHSLHANHRHHSYEILAVTGVKCNITTFNNVCRLIVNIFIVIELYLTVLNMPISKVWGSASRAQRPLPMGIVRWQFPSFKGHPLPMWGNNVSSMSQSINQSNQNAKNHSNLFLRICCQYYVCHTFLGLQQL